MTLFRSLLLLIAASTVLVEGCSLAYSPYANPPARPLGKEQGEVVGAMSALAETRSDGSTGAGFGAYADGGFEFHGRYAFSDKLTLGTRVWMRAAAFEDLNLDGYSFDALYMLNDSTSTVRYALMPRVAFMMNGRRVDGRAAFLGGVAWLPKVGVLHPYLSASLGIGEHLGPDSVTAGQWGMNATGNIGASVHIFSDLRLGFELATIVQSNRYDKRSFWYPLLASGSLAWRF